MLIKEIIFERSRASLYHFTAFRNAEMIFRSNSLQISGSSSAVSFTRSGMTKDGIKNTLPVRLELDHDKLRSRYKIIPFSYKSDYKKWHIKTYGKPPREEAIDEMEERIYKNIYPLDRYLIETRIMCDEDYFHYRINDKNQLEEYISFLENVPKYPKLNENDGIKMEKILNNLKEYSRLSEIP